MFGHILWLSETDVAEKPASYILKLKTMAGVMAEILVYMYQAVWRRIPEARHFNVPTFLETFKLRKLGPNLMLWK